MKKVTRCRCCQSSQLFPYLYLGKQPLANSYHRGEKLPTYPLEVMVCRDCFHSQLSIVIDPDTMFRNYLYVSGTTATFRNHTKELAKDAVSRFKKKNLRVLDIACNDGTQLEYFRELGCTIMGVDPAENLRPITEKKNIPVIVEYWTRKVAKELNNKFDIMTGTNVFAHVNDVEEFLHACKIALSPSGLVILEFPYADNMIAHNEFDTVYHEHLSYFLVHSFRALIERMKMHIVNVLQTPIHGGSIRFFLKDGIDKHHKKIHQLVSREKEKGLLNIKTYEAFSERVKKNKRQMKKLIQDLQNQRKKIIGYGASAKGNTMLNYFKIKLSYIVDDNPLKHRYKTPGRNIPIYPTEKIKSEKEELYIVILSWNFFNEIKEKIISLREGNAKDYCILYVPDIALVPVRQGVAIKVTKIKPEFIDDRGYISRIINDSKLPIKSILFIQRKAGTVTANHYHKTDSHYIYCLTGKIRYFEKDMRKKKDKVTSVVLGPGDLVLSLPMIAHATEFLEDTTMLAFTTEDRDQKAYEKDTVRIKIV